MSMNIGAIMRALLGDGQPADARTLELRVGQIVRGMLLDYMDDNDALLQINGVQVRAKLDADMPLGKGTLLQVQPESRGGAIVLKPLADPTGSVGDESLKDVVKSFGLPDQKWSFELLKGLKRDGYPIDKATAEWFKAAAEARPAGEPADEWANAAGVAYRRGLEPTATTIGSLRQALYGQPITERLTQMQTLLQGFAAQPEGASEATQEAAQRVQRLLAEGARLIAQGGARLQLDEPLAPRAAAEAPQAGTAAAAPGGEAGGGANASGRAAAPATPEGAPPQAPLAAGAPAGGSAAGASPAAAAGADGQGPGRAAPLPAQAAGAAAAGAPAAAGAAADAQRAQAGAPAAQQHAAADAAQPAQARPDASWLGRFMQWLGVEHERNAVLQGTDPNGGAGAARMGQEDGGQAAEAAEAAKSGESLKSALLALASRDDAPPALREATQALAQQITGQQLLLAQERNPMTPVSYMTLFVPIKGQDGETTASIHVETRRGRSGQWDADNCRLLFDLHMSHLGDTLVDVQVVDRIVSLKLLNDNPWVADLMESIRDEASSGLRAAGYQLLSLKTVPYPDLAESADVSPSADERAERFSADLYAPKAYKGVDYRA